MLENIMAKSTRYLKRHSATILTVLGAIGVAGTAALTVKATIKAVRLVDELQNEQEEPLTKTEIVKKTASIYIPAITTGVSAIACIFGANILNKRRQTALVGAYMFLQSAYKEYKNKVKEIYGEDADDQIRDSIIKDKYKEHHSSVADAEGMAYYEPQLFYEEYFGQFFERTKEDVLKAEYQLNREFALNGWSSIAQFYHLLDLPLPKDGQVLGWCSDVDDEYYGHSWIDFKHDPIVMEDGLECCVISIMTPMTADY